MDLAVRRHIVRGPLLTAHHLSGNQLQPVPSVGRQLVHVLILYTVMVWFSIADGTSMELLITTIRKHKQTCTTKQAASHADSQSVNVT